MSTLRRAATMAATQVSSVHLVRLRWAVRAVLALGIIASVAANVLAARPETVSRIISAWSPLALLLTVELISRVPVHRRGLAAVRIIATTAIAGIAAWVSYWHMVTVAVHYGETGLSAHLLPLSVDGLIVVASICLVELSGRRTEPADTAPEQPATSQPSAEPRPPAPSRPVHVVAASTPARRRSRVTARVRPQADLDDVRRIVGDRVPSSRDELAGLVRKAGLSVSNARAGELLRALRTNQVART